LTLITFVQEEKEDLLKRLENLYVNLDTGMTQEKYLNICEQLGQEPNPDKMPPSWEDLPEIAQIAINTFNALGDRVYPEIGYIGKDYTNLPILLDIYGIEDTDYFIEILNWLDARAIKKSSDNLKKEYDKLKRKSSGTK
jgi:hypothetical protein